MFSFVFISKQKDKTTMLRLQGGGRIAVPMITSYYSIDTPALCHQNLPLLSLFFNECYFC